MGFLSDAGRRKLGTLASLLIVELHQLYLNLLRNLMHANSSKNVRTLVGGLWIILSYFNISTSKSN